MLKLAADTVPVVAGRVTPPAPPVVRVPVGVSVAVPALIADTATLPKFISTVLEIVIGVMMVAGAEAVAEACAKEALVPAMMMAAGAKNFTMFFILFVFSLSELISI